MRKLRISMLMILSILLFTACNGKKSRNYVKNIYMNKIDDKYQVEFQVYDFSSQEEAYKTYRYISEDINKNSMLTVRENNLNFRLCENVLIDRQLFLSDFDKAFSFITSVKIPPSVNIICLSEDKGEKFNLNGLIETPLYNFSQDISGARGIAGIADRRGNNKGALIIQQGDVVKVLDENQWKILNMLTGDKSGFICTVRKNEILADFDLTAVYYSYDNGLKINIVMSLKDYKGLSGNNNTALMVEFIKKEIEDIVYRLYNDIVIVESCNLYWFCDMNSFEPRLADITVNTI